MARTLIATLCLTACVAAQASCSPGWASGEFPLAGVNGTVYALATFDDGTGPALYAGGSFTVAGGVAASNIARFDGTTWSAVGSGLNGAVQALVVFDDGSGPALYAARSFSSAGSILLSNVERWSGSSWSSVGTPTASAAMALCVHTDANGTRLYAGGTFGIQSWNGTSWVGLGSGVNGTVTALASCNTGTGPRLYAAGGFATAGGVAASKIACWNGASWTSLGPGPTNGAITALAAFDDGAGMRLYAGGSFTLLAGYGYSHFARWNGSAWSNISWTPSFMTTASQVALATIAESPGSALYCGITAYDASCSCTGCRVYRLGAAGWSQIGGQSNAGGTIYALGSFAGTSGFALCAGGFFGGVTPGSVAGRNISRWTGPAWAPVGGGCANPPGVVAGLDLGSGPGLYAAGVALGATGAGVCGVARRTGSSWTALGTGMTKSGPAEARVNALTVFDDGGGRAIYAGGDFTNAGGTPALDIARWNGSSWSALGAGLSGGAVQVLIAGDIGQGRRLFAGGTFTGSGNIVLNGVAQWDGATWSPVGIGMSSLLNIGFSIRSLAIHDDGSGPALYIGGTLPSAGGSPGAGVARCYGTTWSPVGASNGYPAFTLAVFDDGSGPALYAPIGGGIGKWTGSTWMPIGSGGSSASFAMGVFNDGSGPGLYVGGDGSAGLARWNGAMWSTPTPPLLGSLSSPSTANLLVTSLAVADDGGGRALFAGGDFMMAGGAVSAGIAKWVPGGPPIVTSQPATQAVDPGALLALSVSAVGSPPLAYQWRRNGVALPGATGATLTVPTSVPGQSDTYDVVISGPCGTTTSQPAGVVVRPVVLALSQPWGLGSLRVANTSGNPGAPYFTAFSLSQANAGSPGNGFWLGLYIPYTDLVAQFAIQTPPFVGALDASGASTFALPSGMLQPALSGKEVFAVTAIWDPAAFQVLGGSAIVSLVLQ